MTIRHIDLNRNADRNTRHNLPLSLMATAAALTLAVGCALTGDIDETDMAHHGHDHEVVGSQDGPGDASGVELDQKWRERMAVPVPTYAIDVYEDGRISAPIEVRTGAGLPDMAGKIVDVGIEAGIEETPDGLRDLRPDVAGERPEQASDQAGDKTVFGTDDRIIFHNHNYPYRTVGRIDSGAGSCTGTMVGPRHVMTASHCVVWNPDGTTGSIMFRPSFYIDHSLDTAFSVTTFFYRKVAGPTVTMNESAFDFVVIVLDRRVGDNLGWMGSKTYDNAWNNVPDWSNIGYPQDIGGTLLPVFQSNCSVTHTGAQTFNGLTNLLLFSLCDTAGGQSGGPLYGTWDGIPYVIGAVSAETATANWFAGGYYIPTLINQARNTYP